MKIQGLGPRLRLGDVDSGRAVANRKGATPGASKWDAFEVGKGSY